MYLQDLSVFLAELIFSGGLCVHLIGAEPLR